MKSILQNKWGLFLVVSAIQSLVGWLDFITGYDLYFFLFYLIPIAIVAWWQSRTMAIGVAVSCGVTWMLADLYSGHHYSSIMYVVWNAGMLTGIFVLAGVGLSLVRSDLKTQRDLNATLVRSLAEIRELKGLLPICCSCKKIRDDGGYWVQVERYLSQHTSVEFTHGICPECLNRLYPEFSKRAGIVSRDPALQPAAHGRLHAWHENG